jgi:hypothetical protein
VVQPDRLIDDLGRETKAPVRMRRLAHAQDPAIRPKLLPT